MTENILTRAAVSQPGRLSNLCEVSSSARYPPRFTLLKDPRYLQRRKEPGLSAAAGGLLDRQQKVLKVLHLPSVEMAGGTVSVHHESPLFEEGQLVEAPLTT